MRALLCVLLFAISPAFAEAPFGKLLSKRGIVEFSQDQGISWKVFERRGEIVPGDHIRTEQGASATLELRDGSIYLLEPDSQLRLDAAPGKLEFRLIRGAFGGVQKGKPQQLAPAKGPGIRIRGGTVRVNGKALPKK